MKIILLISIALSATLAASTETEKQTVVSTIDSSEMSLEYWTTTDAETPLLVNINGILSLTDLTTASWDSTG
jgi:hypothetical protein